MSDYSLDGGDYTGEEIPGLEDTPAPNSAPVVKIPEEVQQNPVQPPPVDNKKKKLNPFIEITNKDKVLPYVTSQSPRTNHFKFKNPNDQNALKSHLESDNKYTVKFSEVRSKPYITISKKDNDMNIIGKVHFLYYDKNSPQTKYIKLYLFDFASKEIQGEIEGKLKNFFENFTPAPVTNMLPPSQGGKRRARLGKTSKNIRMSKRHIKRKTNRRR